MPAPEYIMSEHNRASHPIYQLLPTEIEGFDSLAELALDMHWSWNHATDEVWRQLDPELWGITHNPWVVLQTVSRDQIERVLADPVFRKDVDSLVEASRQAVEAPAWFQRNHSEAPLTCAAYFSMEFMLSEALPIYSGGLSGSGRLSSGSGRFGGSNGSCRGSRLFHRRWFRRCRGDRCGRLLRCAENRSFLRRRNCAFRRRFLLTFRRRWRSRRFDVLSHAVSSFTKCRYRNLRVS